MLDHTRRMSVSRETVDATVRGFDIPDPSATAAAVQLLLQALAAEPDPPTTVREPAEALWVVLNRHGDNRVRPS